MADETWPGAVVDEETLLTVPDVRGAVYGPAVGEYHHDAMFGPEGNKLGPNDVALSPDLLKHYPLGSKILSEGKQYTVADVSYVKPNHPNTNTIEFRDRKEAPERVSISPAPDIPTGKKVNVVEMKDRTPDIVPIVPLQTRRATAVHPEDEPWPGVPVTPPEGADAPTMEPQLVSPDAQPIEPDTLQKIGTAFTEYAKGFIPRDAKDVARMANIPTDWTDPEQLATFVMPMLKPGFDITRQGISRAEQIKSAEQTPPQSQERYNAGIGTLLDLAQLAGLSQMGRAARPTQTFSRALPPAVDELIARRVQKPWDVPGVTDSGDFIDVPFVRMSDGTLGERVSSFLTPAEGQRPSRAIMLHPGEKVPAPLVGYPSIVHTDGSQTIFHPAPTEDEWNQVIQSEPDEVLSPDTYEMPSQDELAQPTMNGKEFDNYLAQLARQDQLDQAREVMSQGGTPVMDFISDMGGIISKTQAKKSGLYDRAGGALWDDVPKQLTGVDMRNFWNGTESPDTMAQAAFTQGLIPSPDVGSLYNAWQQEHNTIKSLRAPKIASEESPLPSVMDVRRDLESLGITEAERKILSGKHFVVADTVTGQIRDMFGTRTEALEYLHQNGKPGEAAFQRDMAGDKVVASLPDTADTVREREIQKATNALGRPPQSGRDWDQYLNLESPANVKRPVYSIRLNANHNWEIIKNGNAFDVVGKREYSLKSQADAELAKLQNSLSLEAPETDAQMEARLKAEARTNEQLQAQRQREKDIKIETKLGFKARKLRGDTGDLGQADMLEGGDLFSSKKLAEAVKQGPAAVKDIFERNRRALKLRFDTAVEAAKGAEAIEMESPSHEHMTVIISKNTYPGGKPWRGTRFSKLDGGPLGHNEYDTLEDAIGDYTGQGMKGGGPSYGSDFKFKRKMKFKGNRESGAINLSMFEPIAEKIREVIKKSRIKDVILAKEGAVKNISNEYARQRSNLIRQDFGTIAQADKKGTPQYRDLEALSAIEEAGYDKAKLAHDRKLVATSKKPQKAKKWLPVYDRALRDFDRLANTPNHLRSELDRQIALEKHNGVNLGFFQNYIPHMFAEAKKGFMFGLFGGSAGGGGLPRWFTKTRQFNKLAEAIHEGEDPKSMNAADLAEARIRAGQRLVLYKTYHQVLQGLTMPDGKTLIAVDSPQRGYQTISVKGIPLYVHPEFANYVATLFDPSAVRRSAVGRGALTVAGGQKVMQLGLDTFHAARLSMYNAAANKGVGRFPRTGMRRGLAVLELPPEGYAAAIKSGEFSPEEVKWARTNRPFMVELMAQGAEVAKWGDNISGNLHRTIPGTRTLNTFIFDRLARGALMSATIENFKRNMAMFPKLTREQAARKTVIQMNEMFGNLGGKSVFKSRTFQDLSQFLFFARNWAESQAMNEARAYGQVAAYPVNVATGLAQGMGGKAFTRLGATARARLSLALGLLVAGQVLNMALNNGNSTFQNEDGHKLHVKIPKGWFGLKHTYYFDTAQIPFEFTHQTYKYLKHGDGIIGAAAHIASNKLAKGLRGLVGPAFFGKTYWGGPSTTPLIQAKTQGQVTDNLRMIAGEELPVPIVAGGVIEQEPRSNFLFRLTRRPDAAQLQVAASLGAKLEPQETATQQMWRILDSGPYKKPDDNSGPGKYSQLKRALQNRDAASVASEVEILLRETNNRKEKAHKFDEIRASLGIRKPSAVANDPSKPLIGPMRFTGKITDETKFQRSLTPQDKTLYREAQMEHAAAARYYLILERRLKNQLLH